MVRSRRRHTPAKLLSLGAMVTALSMLCLYASASLPIGRIPLLFLASLFISVLAQEHAYISAILSYLATSLLAYFILPDKNIALLYALLLGNYGILHAALQAHMHGRILKAMIKLFYCNLLAGLGIFLLRMVFMQEISLPDFLPLWALAALAQLAFLLYDLLYGFGVMIYCSRFQKTIVPRR